MAIIIQYGSFSHLAGEAMIAVDRQTVLDESQVPLYEARRYTITGTVTGTSISGLNSRIAAINSAYADHNLDLMILDGSTPLANSIATSDTRSGIRVTRPPSFPAEKGAQYLTFCPFSIELACEITVDSGTNLRAFTESLEFSGGGPRFGIIEPNIGPPIFQQIKQMTPYRVVQRGQAVGKASYPSAPNPIWPSALLEAPVITLVSPGRYGFGVGLNYENYVVAWQYTFASVSPLSGSPNVWG